MVRCSTLNEMLESANRANVKNHLNQEKGKKLAYSGPRNNDLFYRHFSDLKNKQTK